MTRYVVIGAGAIGGGLAGLLARAGVPTAAIARGRHADVMAADGLRIRTPEESFTVRIPTATQPSELALGPGDVLVLSTKTHQAEAALRTWVDAPVLSGGDVVGTAGEDLPIITALNGVTAEVLASRYFDRVVGACVWMPAVHLEPGEVLVRGTPVRGTFHLGSVPSERDESALLNGVAEDWAGAGFRVVLPDDVMPWKYRKLVSNIGNAVQALVGSNGRLGPVVSAAQAEARSVLARAGIDITSDEDEAAERAAAGLRVAPVPGEPEELGGSSWQSLARGTGDIETDYLNGEIAAIARRHGGNAPINAAIARLARQAAANGHRPGDIDATRLAELLGVAT